MPARIRFKRGTRSQLDAAAAAGQLAQGEPYAITDEDRMAFGLSASAYMVVESAMRTWASGMTVRQYEVVKSPADKEDYERITATGGGTTDPADDATNYVARSYQRTAAMPAPKLLTVASANINAQLAGSTKVVLGILAVGARTNALSITGRGAIEFLGTIKGAGGTWRVEVTADGRVIYDDTLTVSASQAQVFIGATGFASASPADIAIGLPNAVQFMRSFEVYVTAVATAPSANCGIGYIAKSYA